MIAEIIAGTYVAEADRINLLIDPRIWLRALGVIRKLAERAGAGEISIQDAKREAEEIYPKAGSFFDVANWSDQAKATLYASIIESRRRHFRRQNELRLRARPTTINPTCHRTSCSQGE